MGGNQRGNPLPPLFITAHHLPPAQSVLPLHASVTHAPARPPPAPVQDTSVQTGVLQALDTWLGEDLTRVEGKLTQKEAVAALVDLYARSHQARETQVCVCRGRGGGEGEHADVGWWQASGPMTPSPTDPVSSHRPFAPLSPQAIPSCWAPCAR